MKKQYIGVIDRFEQIEPKIMIAANGYLYNGKVIDRSEEIKTISKRLPSLEHIIVVEYISSSIEIDNVTNFKTVIQSDRLENYVLCKFNDPLYIVFSIVFRV